MPAALLHLLAFSSGLHARKKSESYASDARAGDTDVAYHNSDFRVHIWAPGRPHNGRNRALSRLDIQLTGNLLGQCCTPNSLLPDLEGLLWARRYLRFRRGPRSWPCLVDCFISNSLRECFDSDPEGRCPGGCGESRVHSFERIDRSHAFRAQAAGEGLGFGMFRFKMFASSSGIPRGPSNSP